MLKLTIADQSPNKTGQKYKLSIIFQVFISKHKARKPEILQIIIAIENERKAINKTASIMSNTFSEPICSIKFE
jgi:hypothetical protein